MRAPRNNSKSKGFELAGSGDVTFTLVLTKRFYPASARTGCVTMTEAAVNTPTGHRSITVLDPHMSSADKSALCLGAALYAARGATTCGKATNNSAKRNRAASTM